MKQNLKGYLVCIKTLIPHGVLNSITRKTIAYSFDGNILS